jgi:hypothetical protein
MSRSCGRQHYMFFEAFFLAALARSTCSFLRFLTVQTRLRLKSEDSHSHIMSRIRMSIIPNVTGSAIFQLDVCPSQSLAFQRMRIYGVGGRRGSLTRGQHCL